MQDTKNVTYVSGARCIRSVLAVGMFAVSALCATAADTARLPAPLSDAKHPSRPRRNLKLVAALPEVPGRAMVFQIEQPQVDEEFVQQLALRFFGEKGVSRRLRTILICQGKLDGLPFTLEVSSATGAFTLENKEFYSPDSSVRDVGEFPALAESRNIAEAFLKKHDLLPPDAFFRRTVDNTRGADVMSVGFGRKVQGIEFWGAGSEIIVNIGRAGRIARVRVAWPKIVPFHKYDIITPDDAVENVRRGKGVLYHGQAGNIVDVKLVYYSSPQAQEYIQPCYKLDAIDPKSNQEFYGVIGAVREP